MWHAGGRVCLIPPSMFCDGSWLEVDLGRLRGNAAAIQAALGPAGLIAVVKSDAYGHGLGPAAAALARAGVQRFAVAYAAEAAAVRTAVPAAELILVLGAASPAEVPLLLRDQITNVAIVLALLPVAMLTRPKAMEHSTVKNRLMLLFRTTISGIQENPICLV